MYNTFIVLLLSHFKGGKCADEACVHKVSINEAGCSGKSKVIETNPTAPQNIPRAISVLTLGNKVMLLMLLLLLFPQCHIIWCYRQIISQYW